MWNIFKERIEKICENIEIHEPLQEGAVDRMPPAFSYHSMQKKLLAGFV
mgnify:CR=1 FL=1